MRGIGRRIHAHAVTEQEPGRAGASAVPAFLAAAANLAAASAVVGIGRQTHARATALALARRAARDLDTRRRCRPRPRRNAVPQSPQFWNEICVSTHWLLQSVLPTSHAQPPAEQI